MAMYTVGRLASRFGLSRSTLLYYNAIGLLAPSARSAANYRLYSEADARTLERIKVYREAGLPLEVIGALLQEKDDAATPVLERHLQALSRDIARLREQQRRLGALLGDVQALRGSRALGKGQWVALLASSGMSDADMDAWHVAFEGNFPEAHQDFLESLGIAPQEIAVIRRRSAGGGKDD